VRRERPSVLRRRPGFPGRRVTSRGYSLIELMIAMLIALFLLAGLLLIVQNMRSTYNTQTQLAQLEDGERLAMMLASDVIQAAGYYPQPNLYQASDELPADGALFQQLQSVTGVSGGGAPGDTVSVRFVTANNDTIMNCTGGTNKTGALATYINTFSVDADGNLDCTLTTNGTQAAPVPLVSGVQNFQVWYGVTTNPATADNNVDTYLTAAQMTSQDWLDVTAVKIRLTFTNPIASQTGGAATTNYIECVMAVMARTGATT
jgi:type IV pilus assembly protein PilW